MQPPAQDRRQVLWLRCGIQRRQLHAQLLVVLGLDASLRAGAVEAFESVVAERLDHGAVYPDRIQDARDAGSANTQIKASGGGIDGCPWRPYRCIDNMVAVTVNYYLIL